MVLIAGDFTYLYAMWDTFLIYFATVVLAYGCGLAHGIIGILLTQHCRKRAERPPSSTQTNDAPANAPVPNNNLGAQQPIPPPMPFAEPVVHIRETIPPGISVGLGKDTYRYHNTNSPCSTYVKYEKNSNNKTRWFTPCKQCFPEFYSR